jgi:NADPH-dependent 2,4-dienoyl-CoA reductase/sulfur reductase-like enzyme/ferredoxin
MARRNHFPNYLTLREASPVGRSFWIALQALAFAGCLGTVVLLILRPSTGLLVFWKLAVPVLPLVFLVAPGLWRNVCPLAGANQIPRRFGFSLAKEAPAWWKEYGYVLGFALFFAAATSRKFLFNHDALATAILVGSALVCAFAGGVLLKGKSGWCSSVCPLYPVQRLYNQTPFALVPNAHCDPCVGCTRNCYDFNPMAAQVADLQDEDRYYVGYRRLFAYMMPGFVLGYFLLPDPPAIGVPHLFGAMLLHMAASAGAFLAVESFFKTSLHRLVSVSAATAFLCFYWFVLPSWLRTVSGLAGSAVDPMLLAWILRAQLAGLLGFWLWRTARKERRYLRMLSKRRSAATLSADATRTLKTATAEARTEIRFEPQGKVVAVQEGRTLLEIAESADLPIQSGCRMGVCGADPVRILSGESAFAPAGNEEKATLDRLGLGDGIRLACACRPAGSATVSLDPRSEPTASPSPPAPAAFDRSIRSVVVLGNGVAGTTAADHLRRLHPECEIHLVSRERHPFYNRMGIEKLIHGRTAMEGLHLQPASWYAERKITCWLNTVALSVDRERRRIPLATGEELPWDRLIVATGSSAAVPAIPGWGLPGTWVLRDADQAMELRAYVQSHGCRKAVVSGGGLLGLEAAHALTRLGLRVQVLERGDWLLRRQLDAQAGAKLASLLESLGIEVLVRAEPASVSGTGRVEGVRLKDGRELSTPLVLAAIGIAPNVELARAAGLEVGRGVRVDAGLRTSAEGIWAAGDACEFEGAIPGLWPVGAEQGRIAAANALGGSETFRPSPCPTALKVAGIDLVSVGKIEVEGPSMREIVLRNGDERSYGKLVLDGNRLVGAILLGHPRLAPSISRLAKEGADLSAHLGALETGNWQILLPPPP